MALAVLVGLAASIAGAAIVMRQKPADLAIKPPVADSDSANPQASSAKIAERVQAAPAEPGAPPAAPAPAAPNPTPATPGADGQSAAPTPATGSPPSAAASDAQPAANGASSVATSATPPAPAAAPTDSAPAVAARAAMLVANADDPQKAPTVNLGSVVWSTIPAVPGQPATLGIKADADIPDLKLHATMTIRKNTDPTLQATHTIDLKLNFADGAPFKGISDLGLPQMRKEDSPAAESLSGGRVKINDNYFLVGLTRSDADLARNLDLMATRAWFDFPILLPDKRIAKLVFEKSQQGDAVLKDALAAWK